MRAGIQLVIMKLTSHLYLRFLHQTEQNYWATSLAFLSHWILHLRFYGENQAHAQAFLGHLLDTSGGGIPLRVARRATIITSLLFLFLPPVHCCSTVYSPPERAEGARDGRILSPCFLSSSPPALLAQCLASFPINSASTSIVATPHIHRHRTCRPVGGLDWRDPQRPAIIREMWPQDSNVWRQRLLH